ncbi:DMT family transporter [Dactylosporangium sp. CA-233914]|uniref:DMT family transporter n=1 Tax=Dactylosporangium sp. CA-233914 TaxID=3239934 RepID=UPI003D923B57
MFGIGEKTVGSNVAGVINATTPLWTVLIAFLAGTDRNITVWKGAGIAVGFAGTVLIFTPWQSAGDIASWGGLACLAASASYGVSYVYMGKFLTGRGIEPIVLSASQLAAGSVLMVLALPLGGLVAPTWRWDAVGALLILGALGTGVAYVLNYRLIEDLGPTVASVTTYLLPVVAVILGFLVVHERVTWPMIAGTVLVLAGVALVKRQAPQPAAEPEPAESPSLG